MTQFLRSQQTDLNDTSERLERPNDSNELLGGNEPLQLFVEVLHDGDAARRGLVASALLEQQESLTVRRHIVTAAGVRRRIRLIACFDERRWRRSRPRRSALDIDLHDCACANGKEQLAPVT